MEDLEKRLAALEKTDAEIQNRLGTGATPPASTTTGPQSANEWKDVWAPEFETMKQKVERLEELLVQKKLHRA